MSLSVDSALPTRDLIRLLRVPPDATQGMPENIQWQAFVELHRRGERSAAPVFIQSIRSLHRRRTLSACELSIQDNAPDEHRLAGDPYIGELWRSYKRCLLTHRTGPAAQILRELEQQIC